MDQGPRDPGLGQVAWPKRPARAMIDSPPNLALRGLPATSQPGAASPLEGAARLRSLGAPLGRVLAGAACSPPPPPVPISKASGCPLGAPKGVHDLARNLCHLFGSGVPRCDPAADLQRLWGEAQWLFCRFSQRAGYPNARSLRRREAGDGRTAPGAFHERFSQVCHGGSSSLPGGAAVNQQPCAGA